MVSIRKLENLKKTEKRSYFKIFQGWESWRKTLLHNLILGNKSCDIVLLVSRSIFPSPNLMNFCYAIAPFENVCPIKNLRRRLS